MIPPLRANYRGLGTIAAFVVLAGVVGAWYMLTTGNEFLPLVEGDVVASWEFKGPFADNGELEQRARKEIAHLEGLLGTSEEYPDYQLFVGIAAQYELLGEGERVKEYLGKALAIDSTRTGLAWLNLAVLHERLGAIHTARIAYAKAVEAQPAVLAYHIARLAFLTTRFPDESAAIEGAFSEAAVQFGESAEVLQIRAQWHSARGEIAAAIAAWKKVQALISPSEQSAVSREISRLEAKL